VYIALPNHLHKKWTIESALHEKHILCEKPFAMDVQEATDMFSACEKQDVITMEGFMYRFNPILTKLKELLNKNSIGELKFVNFSFSHEITKYLNDKDNYRYYREKGGGSLYDLGIYAINFFNFLFRDKFPKILRTNASLINSNGADLTFLATLLYNQNVICNLTSSFLFYGNYLLLSGTKGIIEVNHLTSPSQKTILIKNTKNEVIFKEVIPFFDHFKAQIDHINDCISLDQKPLIKKEETLNTINIINLLDENLRKNNIDNIF
jgi:predicted dehydrogenase